MATNPRPKVAVVLAHGMGERCFPFGGDKAFRPKYAHEVGGVPLVNRVVDGALQAGIERVIVVAGFKAPRVRALFESAGSAVSVVETGEYLHGDARPLAETVRNQARTDGLLVINGDLLTRPANYDAVLQTFAETGPCALIDELDENEDARSWTTLRLDADGRRIGAVLGQVPDQRLRLSGMYAFGPDELKHLAGLPANDQPIYLTDVIAERVKANGNNSAVRAVGEVVHVDRPFDYLEANQTVSRWAVNAIGSAQGAYVYVGGRGRPDPEYIFPGCLISPGARIVMEEGSFIGPYETRQAHLDALKSKPGGLVPIRIRGNLHLGPRSRVGLNALIEGNLVVGADSSIEDSVVESDVLVCDRVAIRRNAVVRSRSVCGNNTRFECGADFEGVAGNGTIYMHPGQCWVVTGEGCDLGAGNFFGTWRFDEGICSYVIAGRKVAPKSDAIGNASYMGDCCRTGVGVMVAPGTLMGPDTMIGIGMQPSGHVAAGYGYLPKQDVVKVRVSLLTKKKRTD